MKYELGKNFKESQIETLVERLEASDAPLLLPVIPGEVGGHIGEPNLMAGIPEEHGASISSPPVHPSRHELSVVLEALVIIIVTTINIDRGVIAILEVSNSTLPILNGGLSSASVSLPG